MLASSPMLPPDLERTIFEIAALARPTFIPRLMRIAWRVKIWVEPLLYRSVFIPVPHLPESYNVKGFPRFTVDQLLWQASTKPPGFIQSAAKYMHLDHEFDYLEELETLLRICSGVHTLALLGDPCLDLKGLSPDLLPGLRRLSVDWVCLCGRQSALVAHPLLDNLTHLEILSLEWSSRTKNLFADLAVLPHLTHFALNNLPYYSIPSVDALRVGLRGNMQPSHVVLLFTSRVNYVPPNCSQRIFGSCVYNRIQLESFALDRVSGMDSGDDFWTLAESFIAARRAGRVDSECFHISLCRFYLPCPTRSTYIVPRSDDSWLFQVLEGP
ncbi:hypothetical protein B0H16DRAFT_1609184 [Mycena metata]|uniref:Uncharacterized protein n=1 Tax=Mycena metata TaxID=1033252 RepID=A0AAD7HE97_9AGAR|nr:hypothetical protein B0H16DRAFT_1609184 [Mycena metata]